jgi:hypothetical protein
LGGFPSTKANTGLSWGFFQAFFKHLIAIWALIRGKKC